MFDFEDGVKLNEQASCRCFECHKLCQCIDWKNKESALALRRLTSFNGFSTNRRGKHVVCVAAAGVCVTWAEAVSCVPDPRLLSR